LPGPKLCPEAGFSATDCVLQKSGYWRAIALDQKAQLMDLEEPFPRHRPFVPPCCPFSECPSRSASPLPFLWQRKGHFIRLCDRRRVQRFRCLTCKASFSVQTFRFDYGLRKSSLTAPIFDSFVSKTTQRQAARNLECTRKTVCRRLLKLASHSYEFHTAVLDRVRARGGMTGHFQLDELETYEHSRRLKPVTMSVLIEQKSRFVVHAQSATLPARPKLRARERARKAALEAVEGKRVSGSRAAVRSTFIALARIVSPDRLVVISTDQKSSYSTVIREVFHSHALSHSRYPGSAERSVENPLWPINHTLMMLRDGLSRLVRRTWAGSKKRAWLDRHAWIWIAYRNYIRGFTNRLNHTSSAQCLGVVRKLFSKREFFTWRVLPATARPTEGGQYPVVAGVTARSPAQSPTLPQSHRLPAST